MSKGTAQKGAYLTPLRTLNIGLAPPDEQRRIVAKLDALLSRVNACRQRLDKIPKLLARFRQRPRGGVLGAAYGRLAHERRLIVIGLAGGRVGSPICLEED